MKELSIKLRLKNKILKYIGKWHIALIMSAMSFAFTGIPNALNPNRVSGKIASTYTGTYRARTTGHYYYLDAIYVTLEDSTKYFSTVQRAIDLLKDKKMIGEKINIIYSNRIIEDWYNPTNKAIGKLVYNGEVIVDDSPILLCFLYFSVLWLIIGATPDLIKYWKSIK